MKNEMLFVLALVALLGIAWSQGWLNLGQGSVFPPIGGGTPPENQPIYLLTATGQAQYDALLGQSGGIFGNPWKINNVQTTITQQGVLTITPFFLGFGESGPITITSRLVRNADSYAVQCSTASLGTFDVIRGESKGFQVQCGGIPHGDYTLQLRLMENGNVERVISTKGVSV